MNNKRQLLRGLGIACAAPVALLAFGATGAQAASFVSVFANAGESTLSIDGEADADLVSVSLDGSTVTVTDTGPGGTTTGDPDCAIASATSVTCGLDPVDPPAPALPNAPIGRVFANLGDGADSFATNAFKSSVNGGPGDDSLTGGPNNDEIDGGLGNDTLLGGDGQDFLADGGFANTIGGTDSLDGQGGTDTTQYSRTAGVSISLNALADDGFAGEGDNVQVENVTGGDGDDILTGNSSPNRLRGGTGADQLFGLEGVDLLIGRGGTDFIDGGLHKDDIDCGEEIDLALVQPDDVVGASCERTGATITSQSAKVTGKKGSAKVGVSCPVEEGATCAGTVSLVSNGVVIGSGGFSVAAGAAGVASVKITKKGKKTLASNGNLLLVAAQAQTNEPGGVSVHEDDLLLRGQAAKPSRPRGN